MAMPSRGGTPKLENVAVQEEIRQDSTNKIELKREMGLFSAVCLIISVMVGSGIFVCPSNVLEKSGSVAFCLVIWAVCGIISYLGAIAFAELGVVVSESGAEYAYFQASFSQLGSSRTFLGPIPAFLYAFTMIIVIKPAQVAILLLSSSDYIFKPFSTYMPRDLPHDQLIWYEKSLALFELCLITFINCISVKFYMVIQNFFSSLKVIACLVVVAGGIYYLSMGNTQNLDSGFKDTRTSVKDIVLAFYSGLWAFDGWSSVTSVTEEIKKPERNIPLSISIAVPIITIIYFTMNVAYLSVLTKSEMIASNAIAQTYGVKLFGSETFIMCLAVVVATFGSAMSVQFTVSRLCYIAAKNGHMLKALSYIQIKRLTPLPAILFQCLLTIIFILIGSVIKQIEFVSLFIWIFYGMAMISLIILRKTRAETKRPYKVPLVIPIMIMILSILLTVIPLVLSPDIHILVIPCLIVLALLTYYPLVYKKLHPKCMVNINTAIRKICKTSPPEE